MLKHAFVLLAVLSASQAFATDAPMDEEVRQEFNTRLHRMATALIDMSVTGNGGTGQVATGVTLPPNALVTNTNFVVQTRFGQTNAATNGKITFSCTSPGDLMVATAFNGGEQPGYGIIGRSTITQGASTTACPIIANIQNNNYTAGKGRLFIDYIVGY